MRTRIITILILCLTSTVNLFSQNLVNYKFSTIDSATHIANYSLKYQEDSSNKYFIKQEDMILLLGHEISLFMGYNSYVSENELRRIKTNEQEKQWVNYRTLNTNHSWFHYRIFKNYPKGKLTHTEFVIPSLLRYEEDLQSFDWLLKDDTMTISGYEAQKAICEYGGRIWIAWFTLELPFNDGPYKFNGLPGLILRVYDTQNHYFFEFESIKKNNKRVLIEYAERQYISTTRSQFLKAKISFRENIMNLAKNAGIGLKGQQTAAKNMALRNNPIELKNQ